MRKARIKDDNGKLIEVDIVKFKKHLDKYHSNKKPSKESIKELYERNKNVFFTEVKSIRYAEIKPELITGSKEYNENFFRVLTTPSC